MHFAHSAATRVHHQSTANGNEINIGYRQQQHSNSNSNNNHNVYTNSNNTNSSNTANSNIKQQHQHNHNTHHTRTWYCATSPRHHLLSAIQSGHHRLSAPCTLSNQPSFARTCCHQTSPRPCPKEHFHAPLACACGIVIPTCCQRPRELVRIIFVAFHSAIFRAEPSAYLDNIFSYNS